MAVISDIAGTTNDSFSINGKATIFQGKREPKTILGKNGDIYFQSNGDIFSKKNGLWLKITETTMPVPSQGNHQLIYSNGENYDFTDITYEKVNNNNITTTIPGKVVLPKTPDATASFNNSDEKILLVPNINWINDPERSLNVVHRSGDETIDDEKTFNSRIIRNINTSNSSENIIRVKDTESNAYMNEYLSQNENIMGRYYIWDKELKRRDNNIDHLVYLELFLDTKESTGTAQFGIYSGLNTKILNTTRASDSINDNSFSTKGWVSNPETSINVVHRTGNETLTGLKTFESPITIKNANGKKTIYYPYGIDFYFSSSDTNYTSRIVEESSGKLSYVGSEVFVDDTNTNSKVLATKGWVNKYLVHKSGDEEISGIKTFKNQPIFSSGNGIRFNTGSDSEYYVMRSSGRTPTGLSVFLNNDTSKKAFSITPTTITIGSNNILPHSITAPTDDNSTRIATTAFVKNNLTGAISEITTSNLTANKALISNNSGKIDISDTTSTELGYLHGVTSSVQTQINYKANDNEVVHKTGNEEINGNKTFNGNTVFGTNSTNASAIFNGTATFNQVAHGTTPSNEAEGKEIITAEWARNNISGKKIGEFIWSPTPLKDTTGLALCNGQKILKESYPDFYDHIYNLYDNDRCPNLIKTTPWDNEYDVNTDRVYHETYGCFYVNFPQRMIFLPDYTKGISLLQSDTENNLGIYSKGKVPNITGSGMTRYGWDLPISGAIVQNTVWTAGNSSHSSDERPVYTLTFDASKSPNCADIYDSSATTVQPESVKVYVYIVVATTVKGDTGSLDINELITEINDYKNQVLQLNTIKEKFIENQNWYRIWSDGWIEQGGIVNITNTALKRIFFTKEFQNAPVTVLCSPYNQPTSSGDMNYICMPCNIYNNLFDIRYYDSDGSGWRTGTCSWYACGY